MRRLAAFALVLALCAPANAGRWWGGWWRNTPESTSTSTSSTSTTSTSSTSTSSSSSTSTTGTAPTTSSTSTTSTSTTTSTVAGFASTDYRGSMIAMWRAEEAANSTRANDASTTCGADCDLASSGTTGKNTTNFVEGTASVDFDSAADLLSCADATCGTSGAELDCVGDCTFGCWVRPTSDSVLRIIVKSTATPGYLMSRGSTNDNYSCFIGDGTNQTTNMANGSAPINEWHHAVCRLNDGTNTQQGFVDGAASGSSATQGGVAASTTNFALSNNTLPTIGQLDECFVSNKSWTDAQICGECSCGADGTRCLCDASDHTLFKACTVDADCQTLSANGKCDTGSGRCEGKNAGSDPGCGDCTLPLCNASAP